MSRLILLPVLLVSFLALISCGGSGVTSSSVSSQASSLFSPKRPLNDTGASECGAALTVIELTALGCEGERYLAQDAEAGRDFQAFRGELNKRGTGDVGFDFVKLDTHGNPLANQLMQWQENGSELDGSHWSCVLDAQTGLMWEVKKTSTDHFRYAGNTYSWFDNRLMGIAQGTADAGACNHEACDTEGFIKAVNESALCGYQDWRLPTVTEFLSIGHFGKGDPAIDSEIFPNTFGLRHWTSQTYAAVPLLAWYMYFSDGSVSFTGKGDPSYLRLVRKAEGATNE